MQIPALYGSLYRNVFSVNHSLQVKLVAKMLKASMHRKTRRLPGKGQGCSRSAEGNEAEGLPGRWEDNIRNFDLL